MAVFGIDLGTTNSLIGLASQNYLSEIVPSCVDMETGDAGAEYFDDINAFRSFKIDMAMDAMAQKPRYASACVIKKLCKIAEKDTGIKPEEVVVSVPADFNEDQRTATMDSVMRAGLKLKQLVNEPTAAAVYIAGNKKALYVVFDLGGGTFDVSIIDSRFSMYQVLATNGRNLGGDNFDNNIASYLMKNGNTKFQSVVSAGGIQAVKHFAQKIKVKMQKEQKPFDVDLTQFGGGVLNFTPEDYIGLMKMTFSEAINLTKSLISQNIPDNEKYEILLVGGSTHCPFLRKWITDVVGCEPEPLTYDPDRVVAQGAAVFADIAEKGNLDTVVSDVTKQLSIGLADGTCQVLVPENSVIPLRKTHTFKNEVAASSLRLALYQGSSPFAKNNHKIGTLVWDYKTPQPAGMGLVQVELIVDRSGVITLSAWELLEEPKTITIERVNN